MFEHAVRDLLARVAQQPTDMRADWRAAPFGHVEAHGGDLDAVRAWVEAHDGYVDTAPRPTPRGRWIGPPVELANTTARHRRFVFPASALEA